MGRNTLGEKVRCKARGIRLSLDDSDLSHKKFGSV
jgi:hypothetical protein